MTGGLLLLLLLVLAVAAASCTSVRRLEQAPPKTGLESASPSPSPSIYIPRSPIPGLHRSPSPVVFGSPPPYVPGEPVPSTVPRGSGASDSGVISEGDPGVVPCGRETLDTVAGVEVSKTWECYDIHGATYNALLADAQSKGPKVDGTKRVAATRWQLKWGFTTVETPDGCQLTGPHASTVITYIYPRVTNTMPQAAINQWETFMTEDVIPHEETHGKIAVDGGKKIVTTITQVNPSSTCSKTKAEADKAAKNVADQTTAKQDAFDKRESHQ